MWFFERYFVSTKVQACFCNWNLWHFENVTQGLDCCSIVQSNKTVLLRLSHYFILVCLWERSNQWVSVDFNRVVLIYVPLLRFDQQWFSQAFTASLVSFVFFYCCLLYSSVFNWAKAWSCRIISIRLTSRSVSSSSKPNWSSSIHYRSSS